jgi:hypothetical protein
MSLFGGHEFYRERDNKPHFKLYMKKVDPRIYRMMSRMSIVSGWMADFGAIEIGSCFGTWCSVQRSIQHRYTLCFNNFWMTYILSCSMGNSKMVCPSRFWKNKAHRHKMLPLEIVKPIKKSDVFKSPPAHIISHPDSFKPSSAYVLIGQDLVYDRMSETYLKE